ncbi:MAG: ATP-binding protein [Candidatus Bipolaricaulota bacterium]|nr:ATP-binding protein [Candidatus Bipolaricaulota bacterium]MDW8031412.1 ATP-binding protein [Candidatus Bipolaricaulota bacterium]
MRALWQRIPFAYQLIGAFAIATICAIVIVYVFAEWSIQERFRVYRARAAALQARPLQRFLTSYYYRFGSWEGLSEVLNPQLQELPPLEQPLIIADATGTIFISSDPRLLGRKLSERDLSAGVPIRVGAERVGTLIMAVPAGRFNPLEQEFSQSVRESILLAGGVALVIALGLGVLFVRRLARPLTELRLAAEQISQGRLEPRVHITSNDELGRLGETFNQMAKSLQRSEQLRRQLILDIAHELRNPLMTQQSHLELLLDNVVQPSPQHLQTIYEQNLLLGRLVRDLQLLALADAGELQIVRIPTPMRELLQKIIAQVQPTLEEKKLSLEPDIADDLPTLAVDPQRIEQVLLNILDNACRYTPPGGTIRLSAYKENAVVHMSVRDEGPGIAPEDLPHIFERFYRGDKSRARFSGGTGLGLAIAKALIEAHGGHIWAENLPDGGACFHFTLPLSSSQQHEFPDAIAKE